MRKCLVRICDLAGPQTLRTLGGSGSEKKVEILRGISKGKNLSRLVGSVVQFESCYLISFYSIKYFLCKPRSLFYRSNRPNLSFGTIALTFQRGTKIRSCELIHFQVSDSCALCVSRVPTNLRLELTATGSPYSANIFCATARIRSSVVLNRPRQRSKERSSNNTDEPLGL